MSIALTVLASIRPKFLVLTPLCILLGWAGAALSGLPIAGSDVLLAFIGAVAAHIAVNSLNEYQDFRSGLDLMTSRTPFSGGSGALPANPGSAPYVLGMALVSLLMMVGVGLYFVALRGLELLPLGLLGVLIIVLYTQHLNRVAWLCLIAPGTGFGLLMVPGTAIALTGEAGVAVWCLALVVFFLVNNLLLLNQIPDVDADRKVGRNHWVIRYGKPSAIAVYRVFLAFAYAAVVVSVVLGALPAAALLALATIVLAWRIDDGLRRFSESTTELIPYLGLNVLLTMATLGLLGLGVLV